MYRIKMLVFILLIYPATIFAAKTPFFFTAFVPQELQTPKGYYNYFLSIMLEKQNWSIKEHKKNSQFEFIFFEQPDSTSSTIMLFFYSLNTQKKESQNALLKLAEHKMDSQNNICSKTPKVKFSTNIVKNSVDEIEYTWECGNGTFIGHDRIIQTPIGLFDVGYVTEVSGHQAIHEELEDILKTLNIYGF
jgi:hypothetical protein